MATYTVTFTTASLRSPENITGDNCSASGGAVMIFDNSGYAVAIFPAADVLAVVSDALPNSGTYTYTLDRVSGANVVIETNDPNVILYSDYGTILVTGGVTYACCSYGNLVDVIRT